MSRARHLATLVVAGTVLLLAGCGDETGRSTTELVEGANAVIVEIVDGDTLDADFGSSTDRVRLLGIDTPESVIPGETPECFGPEASARLAELLPAGTPVQIERDTEPRDRFDRVLGYVHRVDDGLFVNLAMVADGYAETLSIEPNTTHRAAFSAAAADARNAGRGLWGACR